jgi:hypothetical protein
MTRIYPKLVRLLAVPRSWLRAVRGAGGWKTRWSWSWPSIWIAGCRSDARGISAKGSETPGADCAGLNRGSQGCYASFTGIALG